MTGVFDPRLVALALAIALLVWFALLHMAERIHATPPAAARALLYIGAAVIGSGIWSAHLIAQLSYQLPIGIDEHVPTMLFSLVLAVLVSFFALSIVGGPRVFGVRLAVAGLCMGLGLAAMHYLGLMAMQIVPAIHYDGQWFAGSVGAAWIACWLTLFLAYALRQGRTPLKLLGRTLVAGIAAAAIGAAFYAGMRTAQFAPDSYSLGAVSVPDPGQAPGLLLLIAAASVVGLLVVFLLTLTGHVRVFIEHRRHASRLEKPVAKAAQQAKQDALTGLANRQQLAQRFAELRSTVRASGQTFTLLIADLDYFREVNQSLGAEVGDQVLREVAQRLATLVRPEDTVARPEGDEFALLLAGVADAEQAQRIAARVREELGRPIQLEGLEVRVSSRVGIALYPLDGEDVETLRRHAHKTRQA
jgi:diguanylate cyclase (GGDEF)-like protein